MVQLSTMNVITVDHLNTGEVFYTNGYTLKREGLYLHQTDKKTDKTSMIRLSDPMFVKETVQNLDSKQVRTSLCYWFKGKYHETDITMGQLIPNECLKLSELGVDVSLNNVKHVTSFLREQQKLAPHKEIYQEVGWHGGKTGPPVFRHHKMVSYDHRDWASNDVERGNYNLEPQGTLNAWMQMVKQEVQPNLMLQLLLCLGFSSAIVGYLSRTYDDVDSLFVHLVGNSTQGKTTGALLYASVFGLPSNKKRGLQKTWNGTSNATINMMGGNYGIPVVLDELSMSRAPSLTSELYVLTSGQEKSRLTETIEQRQQKTWATTILSTGEKSIFEMTNQNAGLTVRVLEFANITWTQSAENADAIRRVIQDNYGHAGVHFVEYLFDQGLSTIDQCWEKWQQICLEHLPDTPFRNRLAKKYAVILAAGDLANQALNLSLDIKGILAFLIKDEQEKAATRDIGAKAMQVITQLVIQRHINFRRDHTLHQPIDCWGKLIVHPTYVEVAFLKHVLEQQLRQSGFDDPRVIIRDWKERGWLLTEGDRATKRTRIFDESEQHLRKEALGTSRVPKKQQDTTYNIKLSLDALTDVIHQERHPLDDSHL